MILKNRKILLPLIVGCIIFAISLAFAFAVNNTLDNPELCNSCHEMQPYYDSYINPQNGSLIASHKLNCVQCHANKSIYDAKMQVATEIITQKLNLSSPFKPTINLKSNCSGCHPLPEDAVHNATNSTNCTYCHTGHKPSEEWINKSRPTSIPYGPHKNQTCFNCHGTDFHIPRCINCHSGHGDQKLENSLCLTCHLSPHVPKKPGILPNNTVKFTGNLPFSVCEPCHEDEYFNMTYMPTLHIEMGTCTKCHQSHGQIPSCTNCHDAMRTKKHFEGMLQCSDCHRPSAARRICQDCHGSTHEWSAMTAEVPNS